MGSSQSVSVAPVTEDVKEDLNFPKVELHLHLDGAVRLQTLLDLSLEKGISMKGAKTVDDLRKLIVTHEPANLSKVLAAFDLFLPVIVGDKDAVERIAYEMCEDQARDGVIYFEARYSPHLLCNTVGNLTSTLPDGVFTGKGVLDPRGVVEAVKRGFDRGEAKFNVKARSILCCIRGYADWNDQVLELATSLSSLGVVAIDVAGCAHGADEQYEPNVLRVFQEAERRGIHRTVHAGESGGPREVLLAINEMKAERIGHGYRILRDEDAYQKYAVQEKIHLEVCPYSSIMTGSVPFDWPNHPAKRFANDDINFSINTDDPTCFENTIFTEYQLAYKQIGLTRMQLWKCSLNAAQSCFADDDLKKEVIATVLAAKPEL